MDIYSGRCFYPNSDDTGSINANTASVGEDKNPPIVDPDEGERPLRVPLGVLCCIVCCAGLIWAIGQSDLPCADRSWGCPASRTDSGLPVLAMLFGLGTFAGYAVVRPRLDWGIDLFLAALFWLAATLIILASGNPLRILAVLAIGAGGVFLVLRRDRDEPDETGFIRGARLMTAANYTHLLLRRLAAHPEGAAAHRAIASGDRSGSVWIAGTPLPPGNQSLHILVTASTGAGKSVTLSALLDNIRARGERAIVVDNGHEFHRRFGRPDDIVMGPLANDHGWSIGNEIREPYEWARFARSVIPDGPGQGPLLARLCPTLLRQCRRGARTARLQPRTRRRPDVVDTGSAGPTSGRHHFGRDAPGGRRARAHQRAFGLSRAISRVGNTPPRAASRSAVSWRTAAAQPDSGSPIARPNSGSAERSSLAGSTPWSPPASTGRSTPPRPGSSSTSSTASVSSPA